MIDKIENFLTENKIQDKNVIIGFSAGPDSCTLALILARLKHKFNLNIVLAYFNHGWRDEAVLEEEFTKEFAKKTDLKYRIKKAPKNSAKSEENARKLRYEFLEDTAKKYNSDVVFLAHNKNDNIETLIYRIIKGTSTKGLCSIPKIRDIYYRPLLDVTKEEILKFLDKNNQEYKIDSSNEDTKYKRNFIRKKILPLFKEINPNYINNISNLIENAICTKKIVDSKLYEIKNRILTKNKIDYKEYTALPKEYRYEILNDFLYDELKYRDLKTIKKTDDCILRQTKRLSVNSDTFLTIKNNFISLEKINKIKNTCLLIKKEGEYAFENIILKIEKNDKNIISFPASNQNYCYLNVDFPLNLRHRKNGDLFAPYGIKSDKMKLKDYLIKQKIEQNKKDELILLCSNKNVCWILGLAIGEKYKVKNKNCYKVSWRYCREN